MKNLIQKLSKNNKGFSLVELIIVIAIMAILIAILAPMYFQYVEDSRNATLESAAEEMATILRAEIAQGDVNVTGTAVLAIPGGGATTAATFGFRTTDAVVDAAGTAVDLTSNTDNLYVMFGLPLDTNQATQNAFVVISDDGRDIEVRMATTATITP